MTASDPLDRLVEVSYRDAPPGEGGRGMSTSGKPPYELTDMMVCYARCDGCAWGFGEACYDPPKWHTWAGPEDIDHARETGQPDPTTQRCGCPCARPVGGAE